MTVRSVISTHYTNELEEHRTCLCNIPVVFWYKNKCLPWIIFLLCRWIHPILCIYLHQHFIKVQTVQKKTDGLASSKILRLHLHLERARENTENYLKTRFFSQAILSNFVSFPSFFPGCNQSLRNSQ